MEDDIADRLRIRRVIEDWAIARDAGDWDLLRDCWHADGIMVATWYQGSAADFIARSQQAFAQGALVHHFLGGTSIALRGTRAVAQTKMTIAARMPVEGVVCDVVCTGRFHDLVERRDGRWGLVLRQPIYEKDRLDPVDPAARPVLDPALLARFPEGYRHLAYAQSRAGMAVKPDLPGLRGAAVEAVYAQAAAWLAA